MLFFVRRSTAIVGRSMLWKSLLAYGLATIFFGLAIIAAPELLAYLVAGLLLLLGGSLIVAAWYLRP